MRSLPPVLAIVSAATLSLQAAPSLLPQTPHQEAVPPVPGLLGTEIGDIVWSGRYLWIATERGLARLDPTDSNGLKDSDWVTFTEAHGLGRGAVSALAASGDTVWAATLFDTTLGSSGQAGNGLSFSMNSGETWRHIPNETIFDPSRPSFADPEPTQVDNACFGLALDGSTVWAAFFAGSSVRSRDAGRTWERVLPDGADEIVYFVGDNDAQKFRILADSLASSDDPDEERVREARAAADSLDLQSFVHRTFSALAYDDTVWVGTAAGVARSFDGGTTWKQSRAAFDASGERLAGSLSANWVVALARQRLPGGGSAVWAGANLGPANLETAAINFSADNGESWQFSGPTFAWGVRLRRGRGLGRQQRRPAAQRRRRPHLGDGHRRGPAVAGSSARAPRRRRDRAQPRRREDPLGRGGKRTRTGRRSPIRTANRSRTSNGGSWRFP